MLITSIIYIRKPSLKPSLKPRKQRPCKKIKCKLLCRKKEHWYPYWKRPKTVRNNKKGQTWYCWERDWLHYLRKNDLIWVRDKDINRWKIGKILEKKETHYRNKQDPKYIFKLLLNWTKKNEYSYIYWTSINKFALSSLRIAKYKSYDRYLPELQSFPYNIDRKTHRNGYGIVCSSKKSPVACMECDNNNCCGSCFATLIRETKSSRFYCCYKCIHKKQRNEIINGVKSSKIHITLNTKMISIITEYAMGYVLRCYSCDFEIFAEDEFERKEHQYLITKCKERNCQRTICENCIDTAMIHRVCQLCANSKEHDRNYEILLVILDEMVKNNLFDNDIYNELKNNNLLRTLAKYSAGYIIKCRTDDDKRKCDGEICIENKQHLMEIAEGRMYYSYTVDDEFVNEENKKHLVKLYDKYMRILCDECMDETLVTYCNVCGRNRDSLFNPCLNHPLCEICKKRCDSIRHFMCGCCKKGYCEHCGIYETKKRSYCKDCIINYEHKKMDKALLESIEINESLLEYFDLNIATIISQFAHGIIVECMTNDCSEEILIQSRYDLEHNLSSKSHYILKQKEEKRMDSILLFGEYRRIFCMKCIKNKKVKNCEFYCRNFDEYKICGDHELCKCCNKRSVSFRIHPKFKCLLCGNKFCYKCCGGNNKCKKCVKTQLLQQLLKNYIVDINIINILTQYLNRIPPNKNKSKKIKCNDWISKQMRKRKIMNERKYQQCYTMNEHLMDFEYIQQFYERV